MELGIKNCEAGERPSADDEQLAFRPEGSGDRHRLQQLLIGVEPGASTTCLAGRVCNLTM